MTAVQLTRLTMAFGAVSDIWFVILLSRALAEEGASHPTVTMPLVAALAMGALVAVGLFAYGASLNDVLDARHDSAFSPGRPIPAGRIRPGQAIVVTVGTLLLAVLAGASFGAWGLRLTLLTAVGILFYNAAGKFIPAVGFVTVGLVHAIHMLIPDVSLTFLLPVWLVMTHTTAIAAGAYLLEGKRPRPRRSSWAWTTAGWLAWSGIFLVAMVAQREAWVDRVAPWRAVWPALAVIAFAFVARWKTSHVPGHVAAEKLRRYGAMWQSLYGATWLVVMRLEAEALFLLVVSLLGFLAMTFLKEAMGVMNRPLAYRT